MTDELELESVQLTRAVETAIVMVDALLEPEEALTGLIYLQGFFYGASQVGDTKGLKAAQKIAELVLENLQESGLLSTSAVFVQQRVRDLLVSLKSVLNMPELFEAERMIQQIKEDMSFPIRFASLGPEK